MNGITNKFPYKAHHTKNFPVHILRQAQDERRKIFCMMNESCYEASKRTLCSVHNHST